MAFKDFKVKGVVQPGRIRLADYRYVGDEVRATYAQDESGVLQANHEARQAEDIRQRTPDLDMGFKFASVSKVRWLEIQRLGIDQDPAAIINYLNIVKFQEDKNYFTTNKRI